ncbi:SDR family oxidoreductase [Archangium minus]|uniref:SDR family oxidoreductase n=1 Tax=Archangium minus TaxID=83450 RepID=A0ABY9WZQ7_9BACT|nr:SDR family oxidoreductase [Archangium minus]
MAGRASWGGVGVLGLVGAGLLLGVAARRARRIDLSGRVVVITGGGRGLGLAIAREFLQRGCRLAICGRDGEVIARATEAFRKRGAEVYGEACDASDPVQVDAFVARVLERFGTIDVLVNNAGQCFVGPAVELEPQDVETALRNIFWVHYHPTMAVLPHMRSRRFGRIVNITSIGGKVPTPHQAAYAVGKYAATGWSETLSVELAKEGVYVSTITPPPLSNGAPLHVHFNGRVEEEFQWFTRSLTSPSTSTRAERTARVVVDAAEYGDPERAVSFMSWLSARAQGLAPNLMTRVLALVDCRLPLPGQPGQTSKMRLGSEVLANSRDERVQALGAAAIADERRYLPI